MVIVTNDFKNSIKADVRRIKARVTFDISDVTARGDVGSIVTTEQSILSDKQQLINTLREQTNNIATFEPDRFRLDGSFSFADDVIANNGEMGFVSSNLSDTSGVFALQPTLTFTFGTTHSSAGITVTFDTYNDEYASEFTINAYNASNALIVTKSVVGNESNQIPVIGNFYLYKKIEVIITKWSKPFRRARVVEVDFGIVKIYTDKNLIRMDYIEEMDIVSKSLPSGELMYTVENADRAFNILNPDGFHKFLQQRQTVTAEIGVVVGTTTEYVKLGNFYLMEWTSDEGSLTASFTARNVIDLMSSYDYENLVAKTSYNLYQMAEAIFAICGITDYEIDIALQSITTKGLIKKNNCRNILQMIAVAGMSNVFVNRSGKLIIKQMVFGTEVDIIDMDNMYKEPQIKLDKIVKDVEVKYYSDISTSLITVVSNVSEGEAIKVDNTLINTLAHADDVANWILIQRAYRAIYKANWRGNPAHELMDMVVIEDSYNLNKKSIITSIDISYQGYLEGKTESRGLIE